MILRQEHIKQVKEEDAVNVGVTDFLRDQSHVCIYYLWPHITSIPLLHIWQQHLSSSTSQNL